MCVSTSVNESSTNGPPGVHAGRLNPPSYEVEGRCSGTPQQTDSREEVGNGVDGVNDFLNPDFKIPRKPFFRNHGDSGTQRNVKTAIGRRMPTDAGIMKKKILKPI